MFRRILGIVWLAALGLQGPSAFALAASSNEATHPCEKACQQEKLDALFKAMDDAEISRHPKPSNSADCAAPPDLTKGDGQWTYFLGRAKPGWSGGGFAELTLQFVGGVVREVDCGLAQ